MPEPLLPQPYRLRMRAAHGAALLLLTACGGGGNTVAPTDPAAFTSVIDVQQPHLLAAQQRAQRVPVGIPGDYKPDIVRLADGEVLLTMFQPIDNPDGTYEEDPVLYRSQDGGQTWGERILPPLLGRETYFSLLHDGTLFMTAQVLTSDYRNTRGYDYGVVYRSTDNGHSWQSLPILLEDVPGGRNQTRTSRNILQLQDGSLVLGVSSEGSTDYLWHSYDEGLSWTQQPVSQVQGYDASSWDLRGRPWFGEMVFYQAYDDSLLGLARVEADGLHAFPGTSYPAISDLSDRMALFRSTDGGASWTLLGPLGDYYGQMYPSLLRMQNGQLLFTYTQRGCRTPLGVDARLGNVSEQGFSVDYGSDLLLLDANTPAAQPSGGGFGNTLQLPDGTLVTAYSWRDAAGVTHAAVVRWLLAPAD
jgi:hypothetical protein